MRCSLRWICESPSPYNAALFRALAAEPGIDLTVHFIRPVLGTHPWKSSLTEGFRSSFYRSRGGVDWGLVLSAVRERDGFFVVGGWREPTAQLILSLRQGPFAVWTDTPDLLRHRNPVKSGLRKAWLRHVFRRASSVMGTGVPALATLEKMGCPKDKLLNFPYFIDIGAYAVGQERRESTRVEFFSSGRLAKEKGYDIALEALARVYRNRANGFRYRLAGVGPELGNLTRQSELLGIRKSVEFLGWVEPPELPALYSNADVFLHPSRSEPYGVAVLEAMASGLVVIGSDVTAAVGDRIRHGVNGLICGSKDPKSLADQIEKVSADSDGMSEMKIEARRSAEEWPLSRGVAIVMELLGRYA